MRKDRRAFRALCLVLVGTLVFGFLPLSSSAASSSDIQKEIDQLEAQNAAIQSQINAIQRQYNSNFDDMSAIVQTKGAIDQEIALLNNKIDTTNHQIAAYNQMIADAQEELDEAKQELRDLSEQHRDRIRVMEEQGSMSYWEIIFGANSFLDLLDRLDMMQEITAADRRRIEQMRIASDLVTAAQTSLENEKTKVMGVKEQLAMDQAVLEEKQEENNALLRELEKKADEFELLMAQSEQLQDELMIEIAAKERELKEAKYDEYLAKLALQGENPPSNATWVTPVSGYRLTSPFGMRQHPILKTYTKHNGIDMACDSGTPIYATRAGTVTVTSYQAGGAGNYVSINHLDGFSSIYMHMTRYIVSVGQSVSQGQLIGYVGSTGLSTGPHLHFGISYAGTYVNPLAYIY